MGRRGGRIEGGGGKSFPVPSRPTLSFALLQSSSKISMFMRVCVSLFPLVSNSAHVINKKSSILYLILKYFFKVFPNVLDFKYACQH